MRLYYKLSLFNGHVPITFVYIYMNASQLCLYLSNTVRWKQGRNMPFYAQSTMRGNIRAIYGTITCGVMPGKEKQHNTIRYDPMQYSIWCAVQSTVQYNAKYYPQKNIYKNLTLSNNNKIAFWAMNHKTCHYIIIHTPALLYGNHSRVIIYS